MPPRRYDKYLEQPKDPKAEARQKNMDAFELQFDQLEIRVISLEEVRPGHPVLAQDLAGPANTLKLARRGPLLYGL